MFFKKSSWKKLHLRICNLYEDIALDLLKRNPNQNVDFFSVITEIIELEFPEFTEDDAQIFVNEQYIEFKNFNVYPLVYDFLKTINPNIPKDGIEQFFSTMRKPFMEQDSEHEYFLYFIISKIIQMKDKSISQAEYLIEIARGKIPVNNKLKQFGRRLNQLSNYQMHKDEKEISETHKNQKEKTLLEKAVDAPFSFKILTDTLRVRFEKEYTQVHLLPNWSYFQDYATIAGCVFLALRLHYDVNEDERTTVELKMRDALSDLVYNSEKLYEDCYRFITDNLLDVPRNKRGKYVIVLPAIWVYAIVSENKKIEQEEQIVARLADLFQKEAKGYWLNDHN